MTINDNNVKRWLDKLQDPDLRYMVRSFPEDEREGKDDIQIFTDELSYQLFAWHDDGFDRHHELAYARRILRETENGKAIPIDFETLGLKYTKGDIAWAKETVGRVRRLEYRYKKLNEMGYYGGYY